MKKYKIPKKNADLQKYAVWRNLKYLVFYIALVAVMNLAFLSYLDRRPSGLEALEWWIYPLFEAIVVVGLWFACRMTRFVADRCVSGRIKSMKIVRSYGRALSRRAKLAVGFYNYIKAVVVCKNGRRKIRIQIFEDGYDGYYREGGTIVKLRGLNYPLCLESEAEGVHVCAVCGVRTCNKDAQNTDELPVCSACGHTLIDINDWKAE